MSERDIRDKLLRICDDLDRFAGRTGPVGRATALLAPLVVGAGMALVACDGDVETKEGDGGSGAATTTSTSGGASSSLYGVGGGQPPPYGVGGWGGSQSDYGVGGGQPPPYGVGGWGGSQSDYGVGGGAGGG